MKSLCCVLLMLNLWALPLSAAKATTIRGRVIGVADGDTITVLDASDEQHRIRLKGIDAPESGQAFGKVSKWHLSELVYDKDVSVLSTKVDRYGRHVGKVLAGSSDAGLEQIRAGYAWVYTEYANELTAADRNAYQNAEREARRTRNGLWADASPKPPWQFRRGERSAASPPRIMPPATAATDGAIIGNRRSHIYHRPDCPDWSKVSAQNRVVFATEAAAVAAGFRRAKNCP